jgi:hypothetical protein
MSCLIKTFQSTILKYVFVKWRSRKRSLPRLRSDVYALQRAAKHAKTTNTPGGCAVPKNCSKLACLCLSLLAAPVILKGPAQAQDAGKDVPPSHWAYAAVQDLSGKGLIKGYPPDNRFLGKRPLTRYEMATIIERVLARMDDLLNQKANKSDLDNLQKSGTEIRDLVNEFKKELLVIGTDLDRAKSDLAALKVQLDDLTTRVNAQDTRIDAANRSANDAKTLAGSALDSLNEFKTATTEALGKKAGVNTGALRIGGTIHAWFLSALGDSPNGNTPTNTSSPPPGRNWGGGVGDTFRMKRAEFFFDGSINPRLVNKPGNAYYFLLLDTAKTISLSNSGGTVTAQPNSTLLQDAFLGYQIVPRFRFEIGQQKTDLDEEGSRSSAQLLTIERSIMNLLPVNIGRVGYSRDIGAALRYSGSKGRAMIGIWNGNGQYQTAVAGDRQKFADFNAYFTGIRGLTIGAWGGTEIGDSQPYTGRDRLGGTLIYQTGQHYFEAEGAFTRDYPSGAKPGTGTNGRGGYALYAYSINKKLQAVGRFDVWNPAYQGGNAATSTAAANGFSTPFKRGGNDLREYTAGLNYYIQGNNLKLQFNYIVDDPDHNAITFWGKHHDLFLTNVQVAF